MFLYSPALSPAANVSWYSIHAAQAKMTVKIHLLLEKELESRET
jgi:hypothetical protein